MIELLALFDSAVSANKNPKTFFFSTFKTWLYYMLTGWNVKLASINEYIALSSDSHKVPPMVWFYCLVVSQIFPNSKINKNSSFNLFILARERMEFNHPNISLYINEMDGFGVHYWNFCLSKFGFLENYCGISEGLVLWLSLTDWQIDLLNGIYNCDGWEKY